MRAILLALVAIVTLVIPSHSQESSREIESERQIVFGVAPFDGGRYGGAFVPEQRDTIYLTAGFRHGLTVNISDVYYWPITAEYRADFQGLNVQLRGELEVYRRDSLVEKLTQQDYIYVFPSGLAGEATQLLTGDAMRAYIADHQSKIDAFRAGARDAAPVATYQGPFPGFVVELEAGEYRLMYELERDGQSFSLEKQLLVFPPLRQGVTFQIIPEDKWTVSLDSNSSSEGIYVDPGYVIYVKTFRSYLYDHADLARMVQPQRPTAGVGLQNSVVWISTPDSLEERPDPGLGLKIGEDAVEIAPRDYLVAQRQGSALGYDIVPFDAQLHQGKTPSFSAYRIPAPPAGVPVTLSVRDGDRRYERSLRTLDPSGLSWTFLALLVPFFVPTIGLVLSRRARRRARRIVQMHGPAGG